MILADKFDNYNTVILQITIHISTNFILIMIDQPERDCIVLVQSSIVFIESIGEVTFTSAIARFGLLIVILFGLAN